MELAALTDAYAQTCQITLWLKGCQGPKVVKGAEQGFWRVKKAAKSFPEREQTKVKTLREDQMALAPVPKHLCPPLPLSSGRCWGSL